MSELTPERIREAAEVVGLLSRENAYYQLTHPWSQLSLRDAADKLECEQAAEAKREKRAAELAVELRDLYSDHSWRHLADVLLTRYPALADGPEL